MNKSLKNQLTSTFAQMILDLKTRRDIENFFKDFFDDTEFERYIRRLAIIYWLKKGRDKENIKRNLGATTKEITNAEILLKKDGVKIGMKTIEAEEWANQWTNKIKKFKT